MKICSLRNENLQFAKWQSVVCEMTICSLRNDNLLSRCVYSDILNRKFPPKKPFRPENSDCAECVTFSLPRIKLNLSSGVFERWTATGSKTSSLFICLVDRRHHNLNFLGENRLGFMPTNIKCLGKVWTIICLWITRELIITSRSVCQNLNIFEVSKLWKFHSMPRLDGCLYFKPKAVFEIAWVF